MIDNTPDASDNLTVRHLCPLPHPRTNPPQIHPPATYCDHHADIIRDRLHDIRRYWDVLDDLKATARDGNSQTGSKSQAPTQLDIVALTDWHTANHGDVPAAARWLTQFALWVADKRHLTRPVAAESAITLLLVHHLALLEYPSPETLWHRLRKTWAYLRRCAGENRHPLGLCQEPHPDDPDQECEGALFYTPNSARPVVCSTCGDSWSDAAVRIALDQMNLLAWREADSA